LGHGAFGDAGDGDAVDVGRRAGRLWAPITAPIYALLEGLALGGISAYFEHMYPGVAMQAVGLTFGTLFVMLLAYKTGMIRATQGFEMGVIAATGGIAVLYVVEMVLVDSFTCKCPRLTGAA
jgi:uncharacterized YccA/Bax inhibitor family protein